MNKFGEDAGASHDSFGDIYQKKSSDENQYPMDAGRTFPSRRWSFKGGLTPTIFSNQSMEQMSFEDTFHSISGSIDFDVDAQKKMSFHPTEYYPAGHLSSGNMWRGVSPRDSMNTAITFTNMKRISLSKGDSRSVSPASCLSSFSQGVVGRMTSKNRPIREWIVCVNWFLLPLSMVVALAISFSRTGEGIGGNGMYPEQLVSLNELTLFEFRDLLFSEVDSEVEAITGNRYSSRRRSESINKQKDGQYLWEHVVHHGWVVSEHLSTSCRQKSKNLRVNSIPPSNEHSGQTEEHHIDSLSFPFLICSASQNQSGAQRMNSILSLLHAHEQDAIVVSNSPEKSCYHVSSSIPTAKLIASSRIKEYDIIPFTDIMKIGQGTIEHVTHDYWAVPTQDRRLKALKHGDESFEWERVLHITLAAGKRSFEEEEEVIAKGNEIIFDIKEMAKEGASDRRRMLKGDSSEEKRNRPNHTLSVTNAFSLTTSMSTGVDWKREDEVAAGRVDLWHRSLRHGIEADHTCDEMFTNLHLKAQYKNKGFDLVLNPKNEAVPKSSDSIESINDSSASNPLCVTSLIMALSLHPSVIYIEAALPTTPDDFESHWITQSNGMAKRRPFFDAGLKGNGQVISVADSGLDMNSRFFSPVNQRVFYVSQQDRLLSIHNFKTNNISSRLDRNGI